jgi:predicted nuclease of restriction endonuclease-like (RecB) superfamily
VQFRPPDRLLGHLGEMCPELSTLAQALPLPRSTYLRLLSMRTADARAFYETEALREGWSVRQLGRQISSQLYEGLTLSRNKAALLMKAAEQQPGDRLTPATVIV